MSELPEPYPHWESKVLARLGVSRDTMRALRKQHLIEGVHFVRVRKRVCLSQTGLDVLEAAMGLQVPKQANSSIPAHPDPDKEVPAPSNRAVTSAATKTVTLIVWRANFPNTRIIQAHQPGADPGDPANLVRVVVSSNRNFRRMGLDGQPMEVQAQHLHDDVYELVGRTPRYPGKW